MTQQVTLKVNQTVALHMSAAQASRRLGKSHAEQGIHRLEGMNLYNAIIAAATRDICGYNQDILAFPKITSEEEMQAAAAFYGDIFSQEYDKAYARFSLAPQA